jgi:DNA gyrase/topoisomerase IV subunit A
MSSPHILKISHSYSLYVAKNRAIPAVTDGLKHGQRMALWLLRNRSEKIKTMALTGMLMAEKIYVHGDTSANNTIGLLAAPFKNNLPLITGHGFFGSRIAPGEIGAPRYTDVSRSAAALSILYKDLDLIPLGENYDGSNYEPKHLLPLIPLVLLNGVSGVAVGWSTEILPRSAKGLVQATIDALKNKRSLTGLEPCFEKYDINIVDGGSNRYELRGSLQINDTSSITITELPPGMKMDSFKKQLIALEDQKLISDFDDHSSSEIKIVVKFPRGSIKGWTSDDAINFFKLFERITERIVVMNWKGEGINTYPDAGSLVQEFVEWRLSWYSKRYEKLISDNSYELNYWRILKVLFSSGFTKKLGTFADRPSVEEEVSSVAKKTKLVLDDRQLDRVLNLPTYRWTKSFEAEIESKISELTAAITDFKKTLASPALLKGVYISELEDLKKKL